MRPNLSGVFSAIVAAFAGTCLLGASPVLAVVPKQFGIEQFSVKTTIPTEEPEETAPDGSPSPTGFRVAYKPYNFTQAGGHPLALTTRIVFNHERFKPPGHPEETIETPVEDPRDVVVSIPPGLIGNPQAVPKCLLTNVTDKKEPCPPATQVGTIRNRYGGGQKESLGPIYNVTPEKGQTAEFVLVTRGANFIATGHLVRTDAGYGIAVASNDIPGIELVETEVTFWGVPAESRYDWLRGLSCSIPSPSFSECHHNGVFTVGGDEPANIEPVPFLSMPTDCSSGPGTAVVRTDSWEHPGHVEEGRYEGYVAGPPSAMPTVTGCGVLKFEPEIETTTDTLLADAPVALGVNLKVPQTAQPGLLATPHLRHATITLPLGMSISPGIVDGIQACNVSGPEGINFTGPESEEVGLDGELQLAPGRCPDASIVGEAEAETPVLASPLKGHVYLARPGCGGAGEAACTEQDALDGNLFKLYLELGGKGALGDAGVNIKVEGHTEANPATGQLTAVFDENPQTPFSELRVRLNGGPRAPIDNPAACGPATTTSDLEPWSAPGLIPPSGPFVPGTPDATPFSSFVVGGCESPYGLKPGFLAGTASPLAGRFSTFTMNLSRKDREQFVKGIQVHTPPGLLAMISSVPLCGEAAADAGSCPEASKIGTTRVASGAGSHPFEIDGDVYLTGPYRGAPFGLSVVTHVQAGPFNLGLVVVRARIEVDPHDSTATIATDESGPYALPQLVFGVPVRLQRVTVDIDRPGFMFNPTNCAAQEVQATVSGTAGALAKVTTPFAAADCRNLRFRPKLSISTNAHTNRRVGASLDAKLTYPSGAPGTYANIARVKVSLPKLLPSRLSTLQQACPAARFETDPAACPRGSIVGIARTSTPVLAGTLEGPAYFVSHGGEAFPSLIVVLQGDNVRVDLTGTTFINEKTNVTSSTFKSVPDVPVRSFELYLPQGRGSALAATGNLCSNRSRLKMPTEFVGQNGAVIKQSTRIAVVGCKKSTKKRAKTSRHRAVARRGAGG
jgi:hypothetical protein